MSTEQQEVAEQVKYQTTFTSDPKPTGFTSLGKCLQQARTRAGLTTAQVAQDLHLDVRMIEFIERDRFKELGAPVYAKGYLRRYAKLVGVDEALLLGLYDALRDPPVAVDPIPVSMNSVPEPRKVLPNWMLWAFASVFVIASVTAGLNFVSEQLPASTVAHSTHAPSSLEASPLTVTPAVQNTPEAIQQAPPKQALVLGSVAPMSMAAANETLYTNKPESQARPHIAGHVALTLKFSGDSWVEIYDANNRSVMHDMGRNASVREVEGAAPLRVVLGSAHQVAIQINGQSVAVPTRRVAANVARFVVNPAGTIN